MKNVHARERDVESALRSIDPMVGDPAGATIDRVWSRVQQAQASAAAHPAPADRPTRSTPRRVAALVAVMGVGLTGAAAAGNYIATHTGLSAAGSDVQSAGAGEWLRKDGSDYADTLAAYARQIPWPGGSDAQRDHWMRSGPLAPEANSQISTSAAQSFVANGAVCLWARPLYAA